MKKQDLQFHSEGYYGPQHPAVNVKVYKSTRSIKLPMDLGSSSYPIGHPELIQTSYTHPAFTHEWIDENITSDQADSAFQFACEDGWEQIESSAKEILGAGVKVYSAGRSGGWAIVQGLPDVESWDAIMLGKWAKFAKYARLCADDVPYRMVDNFYHNIFLPEQEDISRENNDTEASKLAAV